MQSHRENKLSCHLTQVAKIPGDTRAWLLVRPISRNHLKKETNPHLLILISKTQRLDFSSGKHAVILLLLRLPLLPTATKQMVKNVTINVQESS